MKSESVPRVLRVVPARAAPDGVTGVRCSAATTRLPRSNGARRGVALLILMTLVTGFVYSGVATLGLYRNLFALPAAAGANATIDGFVAIANFSSAEMLRVAVESTGWPPSDDVVVMADGSSVSNRDLTQIYYATSYLLYPRRVWLASEQSDASSYHHARHIIAVGAPNTASDSRGRRISSVVRLLDGN